MRDVRGQGASGATASERPFVAPGHPVQGYDKAAERYHGTPVWFSPGNPGFDNRVTGAQPHLYAARTHVCVTPLCGRLGAGYSAAIHVT
ncbi:hypothetical protein D9X30_1206 [Cupriavidus sp. U2]|nr:hypothetical protein D9X30_1206 [Cupriavidus sp. U2]